MQSGGSSTSGHVLPPSCDHSCQLPPGKSSVWETHLPHPFTYCFYLEEKAMPKRVTSVRFLVCLLLCSLVVHHRTKCPPAAGPHGACQEPTLAWEKSPALSELCGEKTMLTVVWKTVRHVWGGLEARRRLLQGWTRGQCVHSPVNVGRVSWGERLNWVLTERWRKIPVNEKRRWFAQSLMVTRNDLGVFWAVGTACSYKRGQQKAGNLMATGDCCPLLLEAHYWAISVISWANSSCKTPACSCPLPRLTVAGGWWGRRWYGSCRLVWANSPQLATKAAQSLQQARRGLSCDISVSSQVTSYRAWGGSLMLQTGRFRLYFRKNFVMEGVVKHWNRLPREAASPPPWRHSWDVLMRH